MPAAPSTFSRIRFAPAGLVLSGASGASGASASSASSASSAPLAPAVLEVSRAEGLALLEWLGLGRPDFGAISARELAPRCRRRLWGVERNAQPALRARTEELLRVAERAGEGMVLFG